MQTIRRAVFETNSSSTHSITIVSKEEFDKFKRGELFIGEHDDKFSTREQVISRCKKFIKESLLNPEDEDEFNEILDSNGYKTYDTYMNEGYLESFIESYTTKSGDEIVAFGVYGQDG